MDRLNQWLSLIANLGVLVGLVFVALEIQQNTKATQFEAVLANRDQQIERFRDQRDSPYLAGIEQKLFEGKDLTYEDRRRLAYHDSMSWAVTYSSWVQREMGLASEYSPNLEVSLGQLLTRESSLNWWIGAGSRIYPSAFVEFVELQRKRLEESDDA